ncbi:16S rRNA (cytosine(967)-C(5))-methyltransferase [Aliidiomarina sedimenti]|uniref:16S rRNA (cytosine(967)-C(5))-methyltransferase n=1 Tax=Aliidiomarina sedimenti TaxID=1933879 RepID=A0ABY0C0P3_9GAMM|nr:16S rRNA (cytosine(967)-C(5))-methyltransferase RsmB [Aliidiomarina sedimenti]RUO30880.1 16S rRNA (cytosine(967)-C(5))-methyltransferase [Aliidiomarina sedimenti]
MSQPHAGASGAPARAAAASALQQVLQHQRSLNVALPEAAQKYKLAAADKGLAQAIAFGVLRDLPTLEWLVAQLVDKPLKPKVRIVHYLLLAGLYQLRSMRTASHAAISATVDAAVLVRQQGLKGLINAVLRSYQRRQDEFEAEINTASELSGNHPGWIKKRLQQRYPQSWPQIIAANQQQPPMWLRVNALHHNATSYQALLTEAGIESHSYPGLDHGLRLQQPLDVATLPGFAQGWVSVQDAAAQFAAPLLGAQPTERILDACAAPGGKSAHILEAAACELTALDIEASRLERVKDNLQRLALNATIVEADATANDWWDGELFDRILLDAPCSATGVIRRHPDIKWLRRESDIADLSDLQQTILTNLWSMLKPGGQLLYATCSVLPEENQQQITRFIDANSDAEWDELPPPPAWLAVDPLAGKGWQLLPKIDGHDGFYYARLKKQQH